MPAVPLPDQETRSDPTGEVRCTHCGTPFYPVGGRDQFCCAGCEFVYRLIHDKGLDKFYELRGGEKSTPIKSMVFRRRDWSWLSSATKEAEARAGGGAASAELEIQGISCIGCVWLVEHVMARAPGVLDARVHPALGVARLTWKPGALEAGAMAAELQSFGYLLGPAGVKARRGNGLALRVGLCGAFALNTMLFTLPRYLGMARDSDLAGLFGGLAAFFSCLAFITGGGYFMVRSWNGLRHGVLHIDLPISLGLIAAFVSSWAAWWLGAEGLLYFDFVSVFVFLMLVGRWLQEKAVEENKRFLLGSSPALSPVELSDGAQVTAADISAGQRYRLSPGDPVPVRSRLVSHSASLAMDWISGESDVRDVAAGQVIPSGAVNVGRAQVELTAMEPWATSVLASLLQTGSREAMRYRPLEKFIRRYTLAVVIIATLGLVAWWSSAGLASGLQVFIAVLVVSCPCASGVALPLLDELAVSGLRRFGVFVRDAAIWARLRGVRTIAFDKTGTLTEESLRLVDQSSLHALGERDRSALLRMISESWHPVCDCLRREMMALGNGGTKGAVEIDETPGNGITLKDGSTVWRLGRPGWAAPAQRDTGGDASAHCHFSRDGELIASFAFRESIRDDAVNEAKALRRSGLRLAILSGDRPERLAPVARRLDIPNDNCKGGMQPADKAAWIREHGPDETMMVGDGANDSLAFDVSRCCGTPAIDRGLLEKKADFYYLGRGLSGVRRLFEAGTRRDRVARRVILFAIIYNLAMVSVSLCGHMNPLVAAIVMPLSSLTSLGIVFEGMRARGGPRPKPRSPLPEAQIIVEPGGVVRECPPDPKTA